MGAGNRLPRSIISPEFVTLLWECDEKVAGTPSQGRPESERIGWYAVIMDHRIGGAARVQA